jgi:cyclohexanone monooxygenase
VVGFPGADIEGKPRVFLPYLGGLPKYMARCNEAAAQGDEGFVLS